MTLDELRQETADMPGDTEIKIATLWPYTAYAIDVMLVGPDQSTYGGPFPFILIS